MLCAILSSCIGRASKKPSVEGRGTIFSSNGAILAGSQEIDGEHLRIRPLKEIAQRTIGQIRYMDRDTFTFGLEQDYNDYLSKGYNVITNLDTTIMGNVHRSFSCYLREYKIVGGSVTVMEEESGKIVSSTNLTQRNNNENDYDEVIIYDRNAAITQDGYTPVDILASCRAYYYKRGEWVKPYIVEKVVSGNKVIEYNKQHTAMTDERTYVKDILNSETPSDKSILFEDNIFQKNGGNSLICHKIVCSRMGDYIVAIYLKIRTPNGTIIPSDYQTILQESLITM